jgi:hypothetical protein
LIAGRRTTDTPSDLSRLFSSPGFATVAFAVVALCAPLPTLAQSQDAQSTQDPTRFHTLTDFRGRTVPYAYAGAQRALRAALTVSF